MVYGNEHIWGWVIIDKEEGMTSMHVTHRIKRIFNIKKAGHAGTLDPLATGILPVALGQATSLIPYIMAWKKSYLFTVEWGQAKTTDDCLGEVISISSHRPTLSCIKEILPQFQGEISQVPPLYCAAKIKGQTAYARVRRGEEVILDPRGVTVFDLTIEHHQDDQTTFKVVCGSGTYVRSLARDMALALGTYGHVVALRRTSIGQWDQGDTLEFVGNSQGKVRESLVLNPEKALENLPSCQVSEQEKLFLWQGRKIVSERDLPEGEIVCYDTKSQLVALANHSKGNINPFRCFIGRL